MGYLRVASLPHRSAQLCERSQTHRKRTRFREFYACFGCETKTEVARILVIFQPDQQKALAKTFSMMWMS